MENLTKGIYARFTDATGAALAALIGGRLMEDAAPEGTKYPYIVYSIITSPKERTFSEIYRNTLIQFSIYSINSSSAEIKAIYAALSALYDEKPLTITGSTLVWMREENLVTTVEDHTTPEGTEEAKVYHVDFEARTSLN